MKNVCNDSHIMITLNHILIVYTPIHCITLLKYVAQPTGYSTAVE